MSKSPRIRECARLQARDDAAEILAQMEDDTQVVASTKDNFFDMAISKRSTSLQKRKARDCRRLDQDYMGRPFAADAQLYPLPNYHKKLTICVKCGNTANYSQELRTQPSASKSELRQIRSRCRKCFVPQPTRRRSRLMGIIAKRRFSDEYNFCRRS